MIRLSLLLIIVGNLYACSSIEILDGLCYNDKEGSHLCQEIEPIKVDPEPIDIWELCEPFLYHDPETWQNCMMLA